MAVAAIAHLPSPAVASRRGGPIRVRPISDRQDSVRRDPAAASRLHCRSEPAARGSVRCLSSMPFRISPSRDDAEIDDVLRTGPTAANRAPRRCRAAPPTAHSYRPDTSEADIAAGVARSLVDGVDDLVRPWRPVEDMIDNLIARPQSLSCEFGASEITTTAGTPLTLTCCGPCARACFTTSLRRAFASCNCQCPAAGLIPWLAITPPE